MKKFRPILGALLLAGPALLSLDAGTTAETPAVAPPSTNINVPTTATELAAGYAAAIPQMSLKSLVIYLRVEGKTVPIRGIRTARAVNGVLLIVFSAGDMMAINAEQIVLVTDGGRTL